MLFRSDGAGADTGAAAGDGAGAGDGVVTLEELTGGGSRRRRRYRRFKYSSNPAINTVTRALVFLSKI